MATATKSYAIFRNGIVFHVVNVMNVISKLSTNSACVIVAIADKFLKLFVEGRRVWFKGSSAIPHWVIFFYGNRVKTSLRAIFTTSVNLALFQFKFFTATYANKLASLFSIFVMAFPPTKFVSCTSVPSAFGDCFTADNAGVNNISTIKKASSFTDTHEVFTTAGKRTKFSFVFPSLYYFKFFSAIQAVNLNSFSWARICFRPARHRAKMKFTNTIWMKYDRLPAILASFCNSFTVRASHYV